MTLRVDADACPSITAIENIACMYQVPLFLYCDYSHEQKRDYANIILVDTGYQSVDMRLINDVQAHDIVITGDYGVATMAISKEASVLNSKGDIYDKSKIDFLLSLRHQTGKLRRHGIHMKGPKKRTKLDEERLILSLKKLLEEGNDIPF